MTSAREVQNPQKRRMRKETEKLLEIVFISFFCMTATFMNNKFAFITLHNSKKKKNPTRKNLHSLLAVMKFLYFSNKRRRESVIFFTIAPICIRYFYLFEF